MDGRVVVITGANSGIGRAASVALARMGATVVLCARDLGRGAEALDDVRLRSGNDSVELQRLDLADLAQVRAAASEIADRHPLVHVLVNNAGGVLSTRQTTVDGVEMTFGVNHLGHFHLTNLLMDRLRAAAPARIVNVSSVAHWYAVGGLRFDDLGSARHYSSWLVYSRSKLANLLHARELARRLDGAGVTANALHPGAVDTHFGDPGDTRGVDRLMMAAGKPFMISPERGARTIVHLASSPEVEGRTGGYYVRSRRHPSSRHARNPVLAARLWRESELLLESVGAASVGQAE